MGLNAWFTLRKPLADLDDRAVDADRGQRHAGRAADETSEHDDIQPNDQRVEQIIAANRGRVS